MKHLKLFFALFAMLAIGVGNAWAETSSITFSEKYTANTQVDNTPIAITEGITATFTKGKSTATQYYTSGSAIRWYGGGGLNITSTIGNITAITITYTQTANSVSTDVGSYTLNSKTGSWSGNASSIQFTQSGTSGHCRISKIEVTYTPSAGGEDPGTGGEDPEPGTGGETPEPEPGTGGEETWTLVTNASNLKAGDQIVIAATGSAVALGPQASNNRTAVAITKTGNNITWTTDVQIITLEAGNKANTFAFNTGSGYLYAASSTNNNLRTKTDLDDNGSWAITIASDGVATIKAQGTNTRNWIRKNSSSDIFSCYGSGQSDVAIYKKVTSSGGDEPSTPTPSVTLDPSSKDFGTINVGETPSQEFTITTENTTAELTASIDNTTDYAVSAIEGDKVTVTYQPQSAGTHPAVLTVKAGEEATATVNLTGKAVQALEGTWILVTDASSLKAGDEIIIAAKETDVALSTTQNNNNRGEVAITKNSNTITATSEAQVLTLQAGTKEGTLALSTGAGYLHAASSSDNYLRTETTLSDNSSWTIAIADGTATLTAQGTFTRNTLFHNSSSKIFSCYASSTTTQKAIALYKKVDPNEVVAPTFTLTTGEYYGTQSVMITCATTDAKIYYTLDGNDPTDTSDEYTGGAITINETKTLKAIAIKGENKSEIAEATYTILAPLATMQEIYDKATAVDGTATPVEITFGSWVVSAVKEDGKTAFVTDGTKGFVIYEESCGFNVGDILSGTAACKVLLFNGFAELTGLTSATTGLTVTTGGTITTQELDAAGIAALTGVNTGSLIKINGTCTSESSKYYVADVQIYTSLYDFGTLEVGAEYNITGIYQPYNTTKEILPRSEVDIEKVEGLPTATISIANITMEVGQEKNIEATITPEAALSAVQYSVTSGNEYITLNGTTITAIAPGEATITATIAEVAGQYYGTDKTFTVTVKPQNIAELPFEFTGGKADIENTLGMSQEGLGSDYTTADVTTKLKFDNKSDCVIIHFNGQAEKLAYDIKGNGFSGGTFSVQESADGDTYIDVVAHTELGDAATKEHELAAESRYVKFIYTEKSSGNVGLGNITISKADLRQETGLAWNPATVSLTVGDAFTAPTFSNPNSLAVSFESSNTELATVDNAGVISLVSGKTGTATITATYAGDENYKATEATCVINVNPVTDEVVILAQHAGKWYAMMAQCPTGETDRLAALPVEYINGTLYNVADADKALITWERAVIGNKATFKNGDNYLKGKSSTTLIIEGETTGLYQWDYPSYTMVLEGSTTVRTFLYNSEYNCFRNYAASQASNGVAEDVKFSSVPVVTAPVYATGDAYHRTVTAGNYGTICLPNGSSNYTGATFFEIAYRDANGVYLDEVKTLVAGVPYIFQATSTEIALIYEGEAAAAGSANGLYGTFTEISDVAAVHADKEEYILTGGVIRFCEGSCTVPANRAYIVLLDISTEQKPAPVNRRRVGMSVQGENETTGFEDIFTTEAPVKVIENGQLIIIRDGVKYNVQGQKL